MINEGYVRLWIIFSLTWVLGTGYYWGIKPYLELRDTCCISSSFGFCVAFGREGASKAESGCAVEAQRSGQGTTYLVKGISGSYILKNAGLILLPPIAIPAIIILVVILARWVVSGFRS